MIKQQEKRQSWRDSSPLWSLPTSPCWLKSAARRRQGEQSSKDASRRRTASPMVPLGAIALAVLVGAAVPTALAAQASALTTKITISPPGAPTGKFNFPNWTAFMPYQKTFVQHSLYEGLSFVAMRFCMSSAIALTPAAACRIAGSTKY